MTNSAPLMIKNCEICDMAFQTSFTRQKKCIEHARYYRKICKGCGNEFIGKHSGDNGAQYCNPNCRPKRDMHANIDLMLERGNEPSNVVKQCITCGADFYPTKRSAHVQKRCQLHTDKGKREIQIVKDAINPYKVASVKNCEAIERHTECSGKMLVTATEWKRCAWCVRLLTSLKKGL